MWKWSEHTGVNPDFRVAGIRGRVSQIRVRRAILYPSECPCSRTLWYVVIGAFLMIAFLWMLHMELTSQILLGGITAFFPGITIFLIYAMDRPLRGAVSVSPDSFQSVYDLVRKWDEPA